MHDRKVSSYVSVSWRILRADLRRFESSVKMASDVQRDAIMQAYEAERNYWNSPYVLDHCNCGIHIHIINTLVGME